MSAPFDPYHKWLGISPKDQPPDHYRLLGIDRFEADPDVIASAADQRMAHVRSFQLGEFSDLSQKLLNEIAAAKVCLLNAEKKEEYDLRLWEKTHPVEATPAPKPVVAQPLPAAVPVQVPSPANVPTPSVKLHTHNHRANQSWQVPAVVGAGVVVVVLVVALIVLSGPSGDTGKQTTDRNPLAAAGGLKTPQRPPEQGKPPEKPERDPFEHVPTDPGGGDDAKEPDSLKIPPVPKPIVSPTQPGEKPAAKPETIEEAAQRLRDQLDRSEAEGDFKTVAEALLVVADRAVVAGNTALAKELLTLALTASRKTNDTKLKSTVALRLVESQKPLEEVQKAAGERLEGAGVSVDEPVIPEQEEPGESSDSPVGPIVDSPQMANEILRNVGARFQRNDGGAISKLDLKGTTVSDATLSLLAHFPNLTGLDLKQCRNITDNGLRHIAHLSKLNGLDLSYTSIGDDGLAHLSGLADLSTLSLWETNVTSQGLQHLADLKKLQNLYLPRSTSQVSNESVQQLQRKLPACKVYR